MRSSIPIIAILAFNFASTASAQNPRAEPVTLFENVRIFDGRSPELSPPRNVLVRGNKIDKISADPIPTDRRATTKIIHGDGRTLMPGLIDMHWHTMLVRPTPAEALTDDVGYTNLVAAAEARDTLLRGFTTVRDLGGPAFGLKRAIDEGLIPGPRIYPSGAMITVTSGHGDFRQKFEVPRTLGGPLSRMEQIGGSMVADSPDEVRLRTREQLLLGATQIKLTAGGGVASPQQPARRLHLHRARAAGRRRSRRKLGHLRHRPRLHPRLDPPRDRRRRPLHRARPPDGRTDRRTDRRARHLAQHAALPDRNRRRFPAGSQERAKALEVIAGTDRTYKLARKHKIKTAFGTDILFSQKLAQRQGALLASLARWYSPAEILTMATSTNADLLQLSGKRNPYPGKLGVVRRRRARRPAARRRQPARRHRPARRPGEELRRHHERRGDCQELR